MISLRNSLLVLFNVATCTIIASEHTKNLPITVKVYAKLYPEIVKYRINDDLPLYFVDKNNVRVEKSYSFIVQQALDKLVLKDCLNVTYHNDKTVIGFSLSKPEALEAYTEVAKHRDYHLVSEKTNIRNPDGSFVRSHYDVGTLPFDSNISDRTKPEVKLLEIVMLQIAQKKALGLKYNDQVLYKPSTGQSTAAWIRAHKEAIGLGLVGCLGIALYFMLSQNTSNRLIAAPHK